MTTFSLAEAKTIESAIAQALGAAVGHGSSGGFDPDVLFAIVDTLQAYIRDTYSLALTQLFDQAGVAQEWNEGVETAIRIVERLP